MADKILITQFQVVVTADDERQANFIREAIKNDFGLPVIVNRKELVSQNDGTYKFRVTEAINGC